MLTAIIASVIAAVVAYLIRDFRSYRQLQDNNKSWQKQAVYNGSAEWYIDDGELKWRWIKPIALELPVIDQQ